jgi:hypothetical protein
VAQRAIVRPISLAEVVVFPLVPDNLLGKSACTPEKYRNWSAVSAKRLYVSDNHALNEINALSQTFPNESFDRSIRGKLRAGGSTALSAVNGSRTAIAAG